jgi:hypothetical protein
LLGGAAGAFGIYGSVWMILYPIKEQNGASGLDTGIAVLNLSVYFTFPAGIVAIFGALLALKWLREGGEALIVAGSIGSLGSIVPVSLAYSTPSTCCPIRGVAHPDFLLFLTEIAIWPWVLMILAAGALALVRYTQFQYTRYPR